MNNDDKQYAYILNVKSKKHLYISILFVKYKNSGKLAKSTGEANLTESGDSLG